MRLDLIEPMKLEVKVSETEKYGIEGLHSINEEKLRTLDGDSLLRLHRAGFLQGAYPRRRFAGQREPLMADKQRRGSSEGPAAAAR